MPIQPRNEFESWFVERMKADGERQLAEDMALELRADGDYRLPVTRLARDAWVKGREQFCREFWGKEE